MSDTRGAIQELRGKTGAGVMECKKALDETGGDMEKAIAFIRDRGLMKSEKRAEKETGAGLVHGYVHQDRIGVLVELRAETDFVVRSDPFQELIRELAMQIAAMNPKDTEELVAQPYIRDESKTVEEMVKEVSGKVGEKVEVGRFCRIEV